MNYYKITNKEENHHGLQYHALRWAAAIGHLDVVKYLVEGGADIHVYDDVALRWAAENVKSYFHALVNKKKQT